MRFFNQIPDHLEKGRNRKLVFVIFVCIFLFESGFGYYYATSEYITKGMVGGFNPRATSDEYLLLNPPFNFVFNDMAGYNKLAFSVLEKGGFYNPTGELSAWVTPGFPLVLVPIYFVFGYSFVPVLVFNGLCITLAYFFLFALAREMFGPAPAGAVLVLLLLNLRVSYHIGTVGTEPVFLLSACGTLLLTYRVIKTRPIGFALYIVLGLLLGYSVLVRPVAVLFLAAVIALLFIAKTRWPSVALVLILGWLPLSIWVVRNALVFDRFIVSTSSVYGMAQGNHDGYKDVSLLDAYHVINSTPFFMDELKREAVTHGDVDTVYFERRLYIAENAMSEWRKSNAWLYFRLCTWRFKALLSPYTRDMSTRNALLSSLIWCITFLPAVLAGLFLFRNLHYWMIIVFSLSLLILPSFVVVDMYLRYQIPAQLFLTIPAGYAIAEIFAKLILLRKANPM